MSTLCFRKCYLAEQYVKALAIVRAPDAFRKQRTDVKNVEFALGQLDVSRLGDGIRHHELFDR